MAPQRRAMAPVFIALAIAIIVLVAAASIFVIASQSDKTITSPSPPANSVVSANGIEFTMSLNSSYQGYPLGVSLSLFNTLDRVNNITGAENWRLTNQSECGENCGTIDEFNCAQNDVFRIEVVRGYYDINNFSKGTPLDVFRFQPPLGANQCPDYVRTANGTAQMPLYVSSPGQNSYAFSPKSDVVQWTTPQHLVSCRVDNSTVAYQCQAGIDQQAVMSETTILKPTMFNSFGKYTVICGDEWGDLLVAHLVVQ